MFTVDRMPVAVAMCIAPGISYAVMDRYIRKLDLIKSVAETLCMIAGAAFAVTER